MTPHEEKEHWESMARYISYSLSTRDLQIMIANIDDFFNSSVTEHERTKITAIARAELRKRYVRAFRAQQHCGPEYSWDQCWRDLFLLTYPEVAE